MVLAPPLSIETAGEALGLPGGTPDFHSALLGIIVPIDTGVFRSFRTNRRS